MSTLHVGEKAPLFDLSAVRGGKFTKIRLQDYLGKWVLLYFYGGDFTFI